jgi:hypothetical protein
VRCVERSPSLLQGPFLVLLRTVHAYPGPLISFSDSLSVSFLVHTYIYNPQNGACRLLHNERVRSALFTDGHISYVVFPFFSERGVGYLGTRDYGLNFFSFFFLMHYTFALLSHLSWLVTVSGRHRYMDHQS